MQPGQLGNSNGQRIPYFLLQNPITQPGQISNPNRSSGGGGITSIAGLTGPTITIGSSDSTVTITPSGSNIDLVASGGGGGSSFSAKLVYPIDTAPGSPTTWDDEFPGSSLDVKWTATNFRTGTTPTYTVSNGFLNTLSQSVGGGRLVSGITQAVPVGSPWEFTVCIAALTSPALNYSVPGSIAVTAGLGSSSTLQQFGVTFFTQTSNISPASILGTNATWSAFSSTFGNEALASARHYLRVYWDGTNLVWSFSNDGFSFVQLYSGAPGFTPAYIGLLSDAESNSFYCNATYAWFRRTV